MRAVVVVSGGAANSPFTTPTRACGGGQPAGSTDSGLREALLAAGFAVYTSPARAGRGVADEDLDFQGYTEPPEVLPEELTVNSVGTIDVAGQHLAAFLAHLARTDGMTAVDLVAHSMGGLFCRAAIRVLRDAGHPLQVTSLITLGTPWTGSYAADIASGDLLRSTVSADPITNAIIDDFLLLVSSTPDGAATEVTTRHLCGPDGWNARQAGVLDGIPVTIVAGDYFQLDAGDSRAWPHDGLVTRASAMAEGLAPEVVQPRAVHLFPDVHSIFFAEPFGLPWEHALTWDPNVFAVVTGAILDAR